MTRYDYDERQILFSRMKLTKGSKEYHEFYENHQTYQKKDDAQRSKSFHQSLRKDEHFKRLFFPLIDNNAQYIRQLFELAEHHPVNRDRVPLKGTFSQNIKEIVKYFGATDVGIARLKDDSYYLHQGGVSSKLGLNTYGKKVIPRYQTAIVYTVEMDKAFINRAPRFEELLATEQAYAKVAQIGSRVTMYLKDLGYQAMFNNSEYYLAPMVPLAYDAGLGEIGMANHIITKKHGNRVRLGAVFTTLVVDYDHPIDFGLRDFCKKCALCMQNCPSQAITHKQRNVNNRPFYKFDDNRCYDVWLKSGTDCGICISTCPFSQGIDLDKVEKMKGNPDLMDEILHEHYQKYSRRVYNRNELPIVGLKDE